MITKKLSCRLINHTSYDAATNMAIDEAILEAHLNSLVPPTLRLYRFSPPAVSLGYAQTLDEQIIAKIKTKGFDIVRRPTGGRAVLHYGDLTYSFICSSKGAHIAEYALTSESVITAYKEICQALVIFLESLGLETTFGTTKNDYKDKNDCFMSTTIGDIQYKGKKLIGSAQLRRKHAVLQHGSIILNQPQSLMYNLLNDHASATPVNHHANLYEIVKYEQPVQYLEKELVKSFQQAFNCRFLAKELTTYEHGLVNKLQKKYTELIA